MAIEKPESRCSTGPLNSEGLAHCQFDPSLEALNLYSEGLFQEASRSAQSRYFGRASAQVEAGAKYQARQEAIGELALLVDGAAFDAKEWVANGDLSRALAQLKPETERLLRQDLVAEKLHEVLQTANPQERLQKMYDFAQRSRGIGSPGLPKNLFFARTLNHYVAANGGNTEFSSPELALQGKEALLDSLGVAGGWPNAVAVTATTAICLGGRICKPTEVRDWSDEAIESRDQAYLLGSHQIALQGLLTITFGLPMLFVQPGSYLSPVLPKFGDDFSLKSPEWKNSELNPAF